jgi:hypothetical protein
MIGECLKNISENIVYIPQLANLENFETTVKKEYFIIYSNVSKKYKFVEHNYFHITNR